MSCYLGADVVDFAVGGIVWANDPLQETLRRLRLFKGGMKFLTRFARGKLKCPLCSVASVTCY